jgi:ureidoglycolate lyase
MPLLMLEKHPGSTQAFVPMNASRYLVVVALGGDAPDLSTLRAFVASAAEAISYRPGVWHHPMIALDRVTDFACLVWEDGTTEDAVEHAIAAGTLALAGP